MDRIEINISKIADTVALYRNCRTQLEGMVKDLNASVEGLKGRWEGEAQKSFFENHFPTFLESINKHIGMIAFLEKELQTTGDEFRNLERELKLNLS